MILEGFLVPILLILLTNGAAVLLFHRYGPIGNKLSLLAHQYTTKIQSLETRVEQLAEDKEKLEKKLREKQTHIFQSAANDELYREETMKNEKKLILELKSYKSKCCTLEQELNLSLKKLDHYRSDLERVNQEQIDRDNSLKMKDNEIGQLKEQLQLLEKQTEKRVEISEKNWELVNKVNSQLQSKIQLYEKKIQTNHQLQSQVNALRSECEKLHKDHENGSSSWKKQTETKLTQLISERDKYASQLQALETERNRSVQYFEGLMKKVKQEEENKWSPIVQQKTEEIQKLTSMLHKNRRDSDGFLYEERTSWEKQKQEYENKLSSMNQLQRLLEQKDQEVEALKTNLITDRNQSASNIEYLNNQLQTRMDEIVQLNQQIELLKRSLASERQKVQQMESQMPKVFGNHSPPSTRSQTPMGQSFISPPPSPSPSNFSSVSSSADEVNHRAETPKDSTYSVGTSQSGYANSQKIPREYDTSVTNPSFFPPSYRVLPNGQGYRYTTNW